MRREAERLHQLYKFQIKEVYDKRIRIRKEEKRRITKRKTSGGVIVEVDFLRRMYKEMEELLGKNKHCSNSRNAKS